MSKPTKEAPGSNTMMSATTPSISITRSTAIWASNKIVIPTTTCRTARWSRCTRLVKRIQEGQPIIAKLRKLGNETRMMTTMVKKRPRVKTTEVVIKTSKTSRETTTVQHEEIKNAMQIISAVTKGQRPVWEITKKIKREKIKIAMAETMRKEISNNEEARTNRKINEIRIVKSMTKTTIKLQISDYSSSMVDRGKNSVITKEITMPARIKMIDSRLEISSRVMAGVESAKIKDSRTNHSINAAKETSKRRIWMPTCRQLRTQRCLAMQSTTPGMRRLKELLLLMTLWNRAKTLKTTKKRQRNFSFNKWHRQRVLVV